MEICRSQGTLAPQHNSYQGCSISQGDTRNDTFDAKKAFMHIYCLKQKQTSTLIQMSSITILLEAYFYTFPYITIKHLCYWHYLKVFFHF
jgi:hypothetical protein